MGTIPDSSCARSSPVPEARPHEHHELAFASLASTLLSAFPLLYPAPISPAAPSTHQSSWVTTHQSSCPQQPSVQLPPAPISRSWSGSRRGRRRHFRDRWGQRRTAGDSGQRGGAGWSSRVRADIPRPITVPAHTLPPSGGRYQRGHPLPH